MKSHFRAWLRPLMLIVAPFLVWGVLVNLRASLLKPHCIEKPGSCTQESVWPIDRIALGLELGDADGYSYASQNISGAVAGLGILGANLLLAPGPAGLIAGGQDLLILVQTVGWNGIGNEVSHLVSQRPRPFVYRDPEKLGRDPAHYVSFWSGHTSFAAAAMTALVLCLRRRRARARYVLLATACAQALVMSTAIFRIFAGRHFPTDVIAGGIAGSLIAWSVARSHAARRDPA